MKFGSVAISNFMPIEAATISLADRGLVLIQGANHDDTSADSNGAGKSSVADAISWCLWGVTARGVSGDDVVRIGAKGTSVLVSLRHDDGSRHEVQRYRKHKTHKNALRVLFWPPGASEASDLTKGTDKLTQAVVADILGCSYEVFRAAIYAGQEQMPDLPGLTDKNLKILVEEAAGTDVLDRAYAIANTAKNAAKAAVDEAYTDQRVKSQRYEDHLERIKATEKDALDHANNVRERISAITVELKGMRVEVDELAGRFRDMDVPRLTRERDTCDAKIGAVAGEQAELRRHEANVARLTGELRMWTSEVETHKAAVSRLKKAFETVGSRVGTPCGECGKPYCEHDLAAAAARAKAQMLEGARTLQERIKELGARKSELASVTDARDAHQASMTDLSAVVAQRASLQAQIERGNAIDGHRLRLNHEIDQRAARIKELEADDRFGPILKRVEEQRLALADVVGKATALTLEKQQAHAEAEAVAKVFAPAGVRAHILDTVTPFLNDRTAKYLSILSDNNITATWSTLVKNAKGELREKFTIEVTKKDAGASFAAISGGEKRKVRVATAMALQDMVASRATKPIELFVADEIDDALDPAGLERLMMILEEKAASCGSLFVISHNSLKDWCSNVLTVTRRGGVSTIEEAVT